LEGRLEEPLFGKSSFFSKFKRVRRVRKELKRREECWKY
jgi:hypothetical protein